nr:hypothetical protein [Pantoea sp. 201603H]
MSVLMLPVMWSVGTAWSDTIQVPVGYGSYIVGCPASDPSHLLCEVTMPDFTLVDVESSGSGPAVQDIVIPYVVAYQYADPESPVVWYLAKSARNTEASYCYVQAGSWDVSNRDTAYRGDAAEFRVMLSINRMEMCLVWGLRQQGAGPFPGVNTWKGRYSAQALLAMPDVCVPIPPLPVKCDIGDGRAAVLEHGLVSAGKSHTEEITMPITCGANPQVSIVGAPDTELGPGVTNHMYLRDLTALSVIIGSRINTESGAGGSYTGTAVVMVTPE